MRIFRFKIEWWSEVDNKPIIDKGFVVGENYTEAVKNLASFHTHPKKEDEEIIEFTITEVDNYDHGIIYDSDIIYIVNEEAK